jgi:hypothetical protein
MTMSHNIETAVFAASEGAGWTSLGQAIPEADARNPAAIAALCGALYTIGQRPIYQQLPDGTFQVIPDKAAIVRNDNNHVTGIASDTRYAVDYRQPVDIFEAFRDQLAAENLTISHAAILAKGARVAVCAMLPADHSFTVGANPDDRVDQYLTLSTGYDGKHGTRRSTGSIRVVCENTLEFSIAEAMRAGKLRGISASQKLQADTLARMVAGMAGDVERAGDGKGLHATIAAAARAAKSQRDLFNAMANQVISAVDLARFFGDVLQIDISQLNQVQPDGRPVISTKSKNMISALAAAYDTAPGSKWAHGNVWGALNAVTYYATHAKTCRDTHGAGAAAARYAANLDGDAAALKARALVLANSLVKVAA